MEYGLECGKEQWNGVMIRVKLWNSSDIAQVMAYYIKPLTWSHAHALSLRQYIAIWSHMHILFMTYIAQLKIVWEMNYHQLLSFNLVVNILYNIHGKIQAHMFTKYKTFLFLWCATVKNPLTVILLLKPFGSDSIGASTINKRENY